MATWFLLYVVVAPLWLAATIATIVLAVLLARSSDAPPATGDSAEETARAAAHQARRHGGLTAGLAAVAPVAVTPVASLVVLVAGRGLGTAGIVLVALAPATASAVFLAVHAHGEGRRPRERGAVRTASLTPLTPEDVAPPRLRRWLVAVLGITTVAIALPAAVVVPLFATREAAVAVAAFAGLLVVAVATALAAHHVLRIVAERPATPGVDTAWDGDLRRLSAHRVLRGAQLLVGLVGAISLLGGAVAGIPVLVAPGLLLLVAVVVVAVVPSPPLRDPAPARPVVAEAGVGAEPVALPRETA